MPTAPGSPGAWHKKTASRGGFFMPAIRKSDYQVQSLRGAAGDAAISRPHRRAATLNEIAVPPNH